MLVSKNNSLYTVDVGFYFHKGLARKACMQPGSGISRQQPFSQGEKIAATVLAL